MSHHEHGHGHRHDHATPEVGEAAMAELLDLDGEVLQDHLDDLTGWIQDAADRPPQRVLDLGSGSGTGTFALLRRFADVTVTTVDASAAMLHHLMARADALDVADRIQPVEADLDAGWPALDAVDLVWASASLHHMGDPDDVLSHVFSTLRPGGLLAVTELDGFPRFLPDDVGVGRPGLEARLHDVLAQKRAEHLPHMGSDWSARLTGAGFAVELQREIDIDLTDPLPPATARYAHASLSRLVGQLDDAVSADDRTALGVLLAGGPHGILTRTDLVVRATRTTILARRP